MSFLELIFMNALFIIGLYEATEPGRILANLHDFLEERLPDWIYKPMLGCVYCMASVWGTLLFVLATFIDFKRGFIQPEWYRFIYLPIYIVALSGLVYLLYGIFSSSREK